jgi:hypothetical protein
MCGDVQPRYGQFSFGDGQETVDHTHRRGFSRSVGSQKANALTLVNLEIDVVNSYEIRKFLRQSLRFNKNLL